MIKLPAKEPEIDIEIKCTGLRLREKFYETFLVDKLRTFVPENHFTAA